MSTTLTYAGTTLVLPADLYWSDEDWSPVEQSVQRTLTGAIVLSVAARSAGRPITLQPPDERSAAIARSVLETLQSWAAVPGRQMTLELRGTSRAVVWRHQDGAIDAAPFVHYADVQAADYYLATLRLLTV